jgi:hypothetical protein
VTISYLPSLNYRRSNVIYMHILVMKNYSPQLKNKIICNPSRSAFCCVKTIYIYIYIYTADKTNLPNNSATLSSCYLCVYFVSQYIFATCFGFSWSHHQVIHSANLNYWVCNLYIDPYITICPILWSIPNVCMNSITVICCTGMYWLIYKPYPH